ncbi:MAG: 1-acyl-sn-glycerol-3-phosphate acyltransferase [Ferruginibacter sp.]|nr:1-acyl-sn-glycerol-3-phosphate acyltransferase [Ferruginibacter sp.]
MLYRILKFPAQLAFLFYCRLIYVNRPEMLQYNGPLLIAANHPNSFLDAIVIATLFKRPVYSLVRGDVYTNQFYSVLLNALNMMPVYRLSEGAENLQENYSTFEKCRQVFRNNGIVLIFSEGRCVNEWHLRPLKKGTARLAFSCWEEGIPLRVLPTGINFSSFRKFGKNIHLQFDTPFENEFSAETNKAKAITAFNNRLQKALEQRVYEIEPNNRAKAEHLFNPHPRKILRIALTVPALAGWLLHAPLYYPLKWLISYKWNNDHFDSIMVGGLFVAYPFYVACLSIQAYYITQSPYSLLLILCMPLCARALLWWKNPV